ncbi:MAG TPA: AmmeMemoRadiSam system protein B [Anaeromyxobacter sp.]|nr:AmmeMemoRadiSam system protein B [Anaeromyxobacter sp.]
MIREPAVAGAFYPAGAARLASTVDRLLSAGGATTPAPALGLLAPHAGYVYSGAVAGVTYARAALPGRVIVLGPNHTGLGFARAALSPAAAWRTPLGEVPRDETVCQALAGAPGVDLDAAAHAREHSLEVQLPFLQRTRPELQLAGLCLAHLSYPECERLAGAVAAAAGHAGALLIASSDMSHYLPAEEARAADQRALEPLLKLDADGLYRRVHEEKISMCGVVPAVIMLLAARELGARSAELVRYAHSGEVNGEDEQVVGYAGVLVR